MIGVIRILKRIMTRDVLESGRITKNAQDGSREFISLLACISAIGKAIPLFLIYKGTNGDLMSGWVEEVDADSGVYFTSSENGWSNNRLGLLWLQKVFQRHTQPSRETQRRLLIVDGHSSYVNMEFIDWADRHKIIICILPPHSTHRLQPLDVGMFGPLSTAYGIKVDRFTHESGGKLGMSKKFFFSMFKRAWDKSFTEKAIQNAFAKPGIWPWNPEPMLAQIRRPPPSPQTAAPNSDLDLTKAPALRRFQADFKKDPTDEKLEILFKTQQSLTTKVAILEHEKRGLEVTVELQKQKGKKNKKLNLANEETPGFDVYSPAKVERARVFCYQKATEEAQEKAEKEVRKTERAFNARSKRLAREDRQAAAQLAKELDTQAPENPPALKARTKQPKPVVAKSKKPAVRMPKAKTASMKSKSTNKSINQPSESALGIGRVDEVVVVSKRSNREIRLPQRFKTNNV